MKEGQYRYCDMDVKVRSYNTVIVGTGAAGYNAADRLYQFGQQDIAMVTENRLSGTSRNTGSDKQTYYKLSMSGCEPDSVAAMAQVFFDGQCVDGEHALCEAALSAQCFLRLVELGVPFPHNRYGEYVGYKTDHDPSCRATSVGPYTSRMMTECLERSVEQKGIKVYGHHQVLRILTDKGAVRGLMCLNRQTKEYELFCCKNIIFATGGPAGMYAGSAYPIGHYGAAGVAFEAGAVGKNLTEWQFGLASLKPRWNVSGTYMQVLPRIVSTDREGGNPREFLNDYFKDRGEMLSKLFLKGYQWPFDVRKVMEGSSIIDLLIYRETCLKGRRVYLDFRENPGGREIDYGQLSEEARDYLERAGACFGRPIERLLHMNAPAVSFYMDKGVDLKSEMLEIALCAQHNNGGLSVNGWWQTNIEGLFAAGEAAGTHGVYRPGGSALNAGQVGSTRAAQYIAVKGQGEAVTPEELFRCCGGEIDEMLALGVQALFAGGETTSSEPESDYLQELKERATERMSRVGAAIRNREDIHKTCEEIRRELSSFKDSIRILGREQLGPMFRLRETLICQYVYLSAMEDYIGHGGRSRGSALYTDKEGRLPDRTLPELFRFRLDEGTLRDAVQEVSYEKGVCSFRWRKVRPIPEKDDFFENVWRSYRSSKNIF